MKLEVLDTLGLRCPESVLEIDAQSTHMRPGDILDVLGDCPTLEEDVKAWCGKTGKTVLSIHSDNNDANVKIIRIRL